MFDMNDLVPVKKNRNVQLLDLLTVVPDFPLDEYFSKYTRARLNAGKHSSFFFLWGHSPLVVWGDLFLLFWI